MRREIYYCILREKNACLSLNNLDGKKQLFHRNIIVPITIYGKNET